MNNVKVNSITYTTYEDGSVWLEYKTNRGISYEIDYELCEGEEDIAQNMLNNNPDLQLRVLDKPTLSVCSDYLAELIEDCLHSENEMWFVEFEDLPDNIDLDDIEDEVCRLGLDGYVETYTNDCAITLYGGIITKFIF